MKIIVLGSAAGGGFPQWNCNCRNCDGVRRGTIRAAARTQSSIAVTGNGIDWLLVNASPDILAQIRATPALQPARHDRDTGIKAVVLMDAQIDHVTGLLMLREGQRLPVYCTASVRDELTGGLPLFNVLSHYCGTDWLALHAAPSPGEAEHRHLPEVPGIKIKTIALKSKAPPYSSHRSAPQAGDNIGLLIEDAVTGKSVFYAPGLGEIEPHVDAAMRSADCVMVDGSFWAEDEMPALGLSKKTASDMGHLPQSGERGMIKVLDALGEKRKVLIHINNSNPILDDDSPQRAVLDAHHIEVAFDGMELTW